MKKFKLVLAILLFAIFSPAIVMLAGCGATPINNVKAVYFDTNLYDDDTGYAVFELDLNKPTILTCKVNPSGWNGELVFNAVNLSPTNANYFDLDAHSGQFTIINENYQTVEVQVLINIDVAGSIRTIEDRCYVKQKIYPSQIYFSKEKYTEQTIYINSLGAHSLHVYGNFGRGEINEISESEFNFKVISNDNSIINVPDSSRLKIYSQQSKIKEVDVEIYLLDTFGEEKGDKYHLTLHVIVVLPTSDSLATFEGYDSFIQNGDEIDITIDNTFDSSIIGGSTYYNLKFDFELFSTSGQSKQVYISSDEYTITCTSNQESYRNIDNENRIFQVRKPQNSNNLSIDITIATSANNVDKQVYKMSFKINFHFDI